MTVAALDVLENHERTASESIRESSTTRQFDPSQPTLTRYDDGSADLSASSGQKCTFSVKNTFLHFEDYADELQYEQQQEMSRIYSAPIPDSSDKESRITAASRKVRSGEPVKIKRLSSSVSNSLEEPPTVISTSFFEEADGASVSPLWSIRRKSGNELRVSEISQRDIKKTTGSGSTADTCAPNEVSEKEGKTSTPLDEIQRMFNCLDMGLIDDEDDDHDADVSLLSNSNRSNASRGFYSEEPHENNEREMFHHYSASPMHASTLPACYRAGSPPKVRGIEERRDYQQKYSDGYEHYDRRDPWNNDSYLPHHRYESRRYEYDTDAYRAEHYGQPRRRTDQYHEPTFTPRESMRQFYQQSLQETEDHRYRSSHYGYEGKGGIPNYYGNDEPISPTVLNLVTPNGVPTRLSQTLRDPVANEIARPWQKETLIKIPCNDQKSRPNPGEKFLCTFVVGIREDAGFTVSKRLIGRGGENMKFISSICSSTKLRLRGRGSGFRERDTNSESDIPLQINVSSPDLEEYELAKRELTALLKHVYRDYKKIKGKEVKVKIMEHPRNPKPH